MKILVTGSAGFIGAALTKALLDRGDVVIGIDNHNNYYDPSLKDARLALFRDHGNYTHLNMDIAQRDDIASMFGKYRPDLVVNLAAQAGVRYSIENPSAYVDSNIVGFSNILEGCRQHKVKHLVYASSSSVYGANTRYPFATSQNVDHPLSLYAATKKSNELMAHAYSHLYGLPTTGLRFFTVYGPWGRPDMALFKFTQAILANRPIQIYNYGKHSRDFTYIDDIVIGLLKVLDRPAIPNSSWDGMKPLASSSNAPYRVYNIGSGSTTTLAMFIDAIEKSLGQVAIKEFLSAQPGDVLSTWSDTSELSETFDFSPTTNVIDGVNKFVEWYLTMPTLHK
jgi:UDP-glucuronate 4-epimerase